mgnify:CR=1 FL=1
MRGTLQEELCNDIVREIKKSTSSEDVAVYIDAQHYCVKSRGVEDVGSSTITSKLGGCFKNDPAVRNEFMNIVNAQK